MKKLTTTQMEFLKKEFGILELDYNNSEQLNSIRMKCFDIECEECCDRLSEGIDDGVTEERASIAISIVDDLYAIMEKS